MRPQALILLYAIILALAVTSACKKAEPKQKAQPTPTPEALQPTPADQKPKVIFNPALLRSREATAPLTYPLDLGAIYLQGSGRFRILATVAVQCATPQAYKELETKAHEIKEPIARAIAEATLEQAQTTEGKLQIQEKMIQYAKQNMQNPAIRQIYITDFRIEQVR